MNNHQEIAQATQEAVDRGYTNAEDAWRDYALACVMEVAQSKEEFTSDDVRTLVRHSPFTTHDNRAMGGVMMTAVKKYGWMEKTGRSIPSLVGHKSPLQIWKSNIYKKVIHKA